MACWGREALKGFESAVRFVARVLMDFGGLSPTLHEHLAPEQPIVFTVGNTGLGTTASFRSPVSSLGGAPIRRRASPGGFWVAVYPRPLRQRLPFAA